MISSTTLSEVENGKDFHTVWLNTTLNHISFPLSPPVRHCLQIFHVITDLWLSVEKNISLLYLPILPFSHFEYLFTSS